MSRRFEEKLDKYAEVAVKVGVNLQPGQRLLIGAPLMDGLTPVETAPLVRSITAHAYRAGARLVDALWGDEKLKAIRLQHAPGDTLREYPLWQVKTTMEYLERGDAVLIIYAHDPDLMKGMDVDRLSTLERTAGEHTARILEEIGRSRTNWAVVSAPVAGWASKLFPRVAQEKRNAELWELLFEICRIEEPDPVAAWQDHIRELTRRSEYLNERRFTALRFKGPGTDLTVGLPEPHVWKSGRLSTTAGIPFTANLPTEEVFTVPHRERTEGVVTATKPLSFAGGIVERFEVRFTGGRITNLSAEVGEEALRHLVGTDEGAARLGEVALVPNSSPVSRSGLVFHNVLIDENASCHIALGHAYQFCLEGGETLSQKEFSAAGGNSSRIHVDFMIGSAEVDVDGVRDGGGTEPVMRDGEWAVELR